MKFWNKDRVERQNSWCKVNVINDRSTWSGVNRFEYLKLWCQRQESRGRFYCYYASDNWWFEFEEDAIWFSLNWGGK